MSLGLWLHLHTVKREDRHLLWKFTLATTQSYNSCGIQHGQAEAVVSRLEAHTM